MGIVTQGLGKTVVLKNGEPLAILQDVSITIEQGEMVAIQGASGAGKSTLLHILGLLDTATEGEYWLDGAPVQHMKKKEAARQRNQTFGFVMQDFALIEDESVLDNILLPVLLGGGNMGKARERAGTLLAQFGLSDFAARRVGYLSGGEKQRVAMIRALINDPPYLLADEPTGALDSKSAALMMDIFSMVRKNWQKTIVIVTHNAGVAARCDRILRLSDGRMLP